VQRLLPEQLTMRTLGLGRLGVRLDGPLRLEFPERARPFLREAAQDDFVIDVVPGQPGRAGPSQVEAVVWEGRETAQGLELVLQVAPGAPVLALCELDLVAGRGVLRIDPKIDWGTNPAWCSTLLQLVVAHLAVTRGALLVHAATAVVDGRVWLLAGNSGAGKTTLARQLRARGARLFADDRCLVFAGEPLVACGAPWGGELSCEPGVAPVTRLLFLEKGARHELRPLGRTAATARLVATALGPFWNAGMMGQALMVAKEIAGTVVCEEAWLADDGRAADFLVSQEAR